MTGSRNQVILLVSSLWLLLVLMTDARPNKAISQRPKGKNSRMKTIALFPKARSWCRAQEIGQIIEHEGCTPKKITNNFCIGQCFSYASPDILPSETELRLKYCDSCQPTKRNWVKVNLECPGQPNGVDKLVEMVLECKCKDCRRNFN